MHLHTYMIYYENNYVSLCELDQCHRKTYPQENIFLGLSILLDNFTWDENVQLDSKTCPTLELL